MADVSPNGRNTAPPTKSEWTTWANASVRIVNDMPVARTQTRPMRAAAIAAASTPATTCVSSDVESPNVNRKAPA